MNRQLKRQLVRARMLGYGTTTDGMVRAIFEGVNDAM